MREQGLNRELKPRDGAVIYFVALAVNIIISGIATFIKDENVKIYVGYLASQVAFIAVCGVMLGIRRIPLVEVAPTKKFSFIGLLITVPITIGVFMQNTLIATLFSWLLDVIGVEASVTVPAINGVWDIVLTVLFICVFPMLGEELMFRGVMLTSLKGEGIGKAVWLSGLIFALSHFNPAQLMHQFILGVILSYITVATGNILYACAIHFFNNLTALFIGAVIPSYDSLSVISAKSALIMLAMCVVGALILYPSIYALVKVVGQEKYKGKGGYKLPLIEKPLPSQGEAVAVKRKPDAIFIGFIVFLVAMSILSAIVSWIPE